MTIEEAALLILQSYTISNGGEIFVLNMGQPVKIYDLAKKMIELSGYKISKKSNNSNNDEIEIVFKGLEQGEKMHEELLINNISHPTSNENILEADEGSIDENILELTIPEIIKFLENKAEDKLVRILENKVEGFKKN